MNITNRKILGYILLPQILPRIRELGAAGFSHIAFYMAMVYRAARLLPPEHPYLNAANIGRFGIRHVIAQAAAQLQWRRGHIDQIAVFCLLLVGLVLLFLQIILLMLGAFTQAAHATLPTSYGEFFNTAAPEHDIAFVLLDRVFGVDGVFGSCVDMGTPCYNNDAVDLPYPIHDALHTIFQFYSVGLLVVATIIFGYFVVAVLAETAQTGTPFGKRFNHIWAPVRMVVALGLLIPLGSGLNSAQYITLYAAKFGSGFATNGWNLFVDTAVGSEMTLLGQRERLVATPNMPGTNEITVFFSMVAACLRAELHTNNRDDIHAYLMNPNSTLPTPPLLNETSYTEARDDYYGQSTRAPGGAGGGQRFESSKMLIYFGERSQSTIRVMDTDTTVENYASRIQNVEPTCGALTLEITDSDTLGSEGSQYLTEQYYNMIVQLWNAVSDETGGSAEISIGSMGTVARQIGDSTWLRQSTLEIRDEDAPLPTIEERRDALADYENYIHEAIQGAVERQRESDRWMEDSRQLGWAGAAIWYNQIAALNGALVSAVYNLPFIVKYPMIVERVIKERGTGSQTLGNLDKFNPRDPNGELVNLPRPDGAAKAQTMYLIVGQWIDAFPPSSGNAFMDFIGTVFGMDALFNIHENSDVHPLAQLVAIGKGIINKSIAHLMDASIGFGISAAASIFDNSILNAIGGAAGTLSSIQGSIAFIGLGVGFVLFYLIPFLPFLYFFFAVGNWVKAIFEAMVGVPLWALAHIRIDGNGLPGDAAMGGYFMILEIFLRPIMIIFGLLASITLFAAQVRVLHDIWQIVVSNVSGFDREAAAAVGTGLTGAIEFLRRPVDQLFYTVIYAVTIYMLGMASFKLIDLLPKNILRWMGAIVRSFDDGGGEQASSLIQSSLLGSQIVSQNIGAAARSGGSAIRSAASILK